LPRVGDGWHNPLVTIRAQQNVSLMQPSALNLGMLATTPLKRDPFPYIVLPEFIRADAYPGISRDFPDICKPGSFPVSELKFGGRFAALLDELQGDAVAKAFSHKLEINLYDHPTMITVRGVCRSSDGKIHTDSRTKIVTVLIYMNDSWEDVDGRLRLLHSGHGLEGAVSEVVPGPGTLVAFRNMPNAWHGHTTYSGYRRAIQLNWVTDESVVIREQRRHRLSARVKKLNPFV